MMSNLDSLRLSSSPRDIERTRRKFGYLSHSVHCVKVGVEVKLNLLVELQGDQLKATDEGNALATSETYASQRRPTE